MPIPQATEALKKATNIAVQTFDAMATEGGNGTMKHVVGAIGKEMGPTVGRYCARAALVVSLVPLIWHYFSSKRANEHEQATRKQLEYTALQVQQMTRQMQQMQTRLEDLKTTLPKAPETATTPYSGYPLPYYAPYPTYPYGR